VLCSNGPRFGSVLSIVAENTVKDPDWALEPVDHFEHYDYWDSICDDDQQYGRFYRVVFGSSRILCSHGLAGRGETAGASWLNPASKLGVRIVAVAAIVTVTGYAIGRAHAAVAQQPIWSDQVYLNAMNDVEAAGDKFGFMAGDRGVVVRTTDGGKTWSAPLHTGTRDDVNTLFATAVEGHPVCIVGRTEGTVKDQTHHGVVSSFDAGENWKYVKLFEDEELMTGACAQKAAGVAWLIIKTPDNRPSGPPGTVRLKITHDYGKSWDDEISLHVAPLKIRPIDGRSAWSYQGNQIIRTDDGGVSWPISVPLPFVPGEYIVGFSLLADDAVTITSSSHVFLVSRNGAVRSLPGIQAGALHSAKIGPAGSGAAIGQHAANIYTTSDVRRGGWLKSDVIAVSATNTTALTDGTVLWLNQHGEVELAAPNATKSIVTYAVPKGTKIQQVAVANGRHAIATTDVQGEILSTSNSGIDWQFKQIADDETITAIGLDPSGFALAGTESGQLFRSHDFGLNWELAQPPPRQGSVTRLAMLDGGRAWVEIAEGSAPIRRMEMFLVEGLGTNWRALFDSGSLVAFQVVKAEIRGITADGTVIAMSPDDNNWTVLSRDVANQLRAFRQSESSDAQINTMTWLDASTGLAAGNDGLLFRTEDGGLDWRAIPLDDPQPDIRFIHCFDFDSCLFYGYVDIGNGLDENYRTTTNAGAIWTTQPQIGDGTWHAMAIAPDGKGVAVLDNGSSYIMGMAKGFDYTVGVNETALGDFHFDLAVGRQTGVGSIGSVSLRVRFNDNGKWWAIPIARKALSASDGHIDFSWRPGKDTPIASGTKVGIWVVLVSKNGVPSARLLPPQIYLSWVARHPVAVTTAITLSSIVLLMLLFLLTAYYAVPALLVAVDARQEDIFDSIDSISPVKLGGALRTFALGPLVRGLARSNRVMNAWIAYYAAEKSHFSDLGDKLRESYLARPEIMDAWVNRRVSAVRRHEESEQKVLGARTFVPLPVIMAHSSSEEGQIIAATSASVRKLLSDGRFLVQIVGVGGSGKTTLAGQIVNWTMESDPNTRFLPDGTALAIMIRGNLTSIVDSLRTSLSKAYADVDSLSYDTNILFAALRLRRLVVVFDAYSESSASTQALIAQAFADLPLSMMIITARTAATNILDSWAEIRTQQISAHEVNRFVAQYLYRIGPKDPLTPEQELRLSENLIELVKKRPGEDGLPAVLITMFIDEFVRSHSGNAAQDVPLTIASTIRRYVRSINLGPMRSEVSGEALIDIATHLAILSLGNTFTPAEFEYSDAMQALLAASFTRSAGDAILATLRDANLIVDRLSAAGTYLRFRLDPVAEYLTAAFNAKACGQDAARWRLHLDELEKLHQGSGYPTGYVSALRDTAPALSLPKELEAMILESLLQSSHHSA
jgi:photosystem II stability/assembly factor-like uncharacterized protein/thymidylate kinase